MLSFSHGREFRPAATRVMIITFRPAGTADYPLAKEGDSMISVDLLSQITSDTACAVYSTEGSILRVNEEFGRLLNVPPEQLRGTKLWDLIVELQEKDFDSYLARFPLGEAVEDSTVYQGAELRQRPVSTITIPFRTGGDVHYLLFVRSLKNDVDYVHSTPISPRETTSSNLSPNQNGNKSGQNLNPS